MVRKVSYFCIVFFTCIWLIIRILTAGRINMVSLKKYKILNIIVVSSYPRLQILHVYGPMPDEKIQNVEYTRSCVVLSPATDFARVRPNARWKNVVLSSWLSYDRVGWFFVLLCQDLLKNSCPSSIVWFLIRRDRIIFAEVIDLKNL